MQELNQFNPLKCLFYSDKIKIILDNKIPVPVVLNLDITNKCNFKCLWCYVEEYISNKKQMSYSTVIKIIQETANFGIKSILFTGGGEPTLHADFIDIIKFAAKTNLEIGLTTNGTQLHKYINRLPLENFKYIRISFDAGTEETYAKVHGIKNKDIFHRILRAAKCISHRGKHQCQIGLAFLVTPYNYLEIPLAIKLAEDNGFDYISLRPSVSKSFLTENQLQEAVKLCYAVISSKIQIYRLKHRFEKLSEIQEKYPCTSTPLVAVVTSDAKLNLCCQYRGNPKYQWGDLRSDNFSDIWGNTAHQELIKAIDVEKCPVCRMICYNKNIKEIFIKDKMHRSFL